MRVSVVICTFNRLGGLRQTLDALRRQTLRCFEVVVVDGPSTDGTGPFLESCAGTLRAAHNPERHLSRSRNIGIAAAAGDVVAFIDDDAIPEARWLEDLTAPFADPDVGGTGGVVLDNTGVREQWHYLVCARDGQPDFDQVPPLDRFTGPGADPFLYLPGGNSALRRAALERIGGFDEEIEYNYDETEVCLQLHDAGWRLQAVDGAVVHHRFLPSHLRSETAFTDPYAEVKNRTYFALRHGRRGRLDADVLASVNRHVGHLRAGARDAARQGRLDAAQLRHYLGRADAGFHAGLQRGLHGERRGVTIPPPDPEAFLPYPTLEPGRRVAVIGDREEAGRRAAAGDEVHLLLPAGPDERYRVDYDAGVWVRTVPVRPRWGVEDPALERVAALRAALAHVGEAEVAGAAEELGADLPPGPLTDPARFPFDWELEARACLGLESDAEFVDCLYARLFGREPDELGRRAALVDLATGTARRDLVARFATSIEGRGRGIDAGFVERLPPVSRRRAEALLRRAWLRDDADFVREASAALLGEPDGTPLAGDRVAFVREIAGRPAVRDRVAGAEHLPPPDVRTWGELLTALEAAADAPADELAAVAYRVLLGRPVDEAGLWGVRQALREGGSRRDVIAGLAASPEAAMRGIPGDAVADALGESRAYRRAEARERVRGAVRRITGRRG